MEKKTTECSDCVFNAFISYHNTCVVLDKVTGEGILEECPLKNGDITVSLKVPSTNSFPEQDNLINQITKLFEGTSYGVALEDEDDGGLEEYEGQLKKGSVIAITNTIDNGVYCDYYVHEFNKEKLLYDFQVKEDESFSCKDEYIEIFEILQKGL